MCAIAVYYGFSLKRKITVSSELVARAVPFERSTENTRVSLLILGDSTAVGVGADTPEDTVAGRLAGHIGATYVENRAKSGAVVADLEGQMQGAKLSRYSYILIEIGGNDIIRFHNAETQARELARTLEQLPKTENLIVHSAGNVGATTFFPWFVRPFHTKLNLKYHEAFARVVEESGGVYVNLYEAPALDPFALHPDIYLSADGLHPSSEGYRLWFEKIAIPMKIW